MRKHDMKGKCAFVAGLLAALACAVATAQPLLPQTPWAPQAAPAGLPANEQARAAIASDPRVVRAREDLQAARHRSEALRAGPYEWVARAGTQRRRYRDIAENSNEWTVGVERPIRIGGKAELDSQLGEAAIRIAEARHGEARREAARSLLELWLAWRSADDLLSLWREQVAAAEAGLGAALTRRRAGDASLIEENAARADLTEAQRRVSNAANDSAKALARLRARFPGLALAGPGDRDSGEPQPLAGPSASWRERILSESAEIRALNAEMRRAELTAARARAERTPDPTVGAYAGTEARNNERIVGLTISIPIGGTYREAQASEALRLVDAARAAIEAARRELEASAAANLAEADNSVERWRLAQQSLTLSRDNLRLTQRGYTLGESDVQSVLLARRQAVDAALGAAQARFDALQARWRLLVDANLIWGLHDD